MLNHIGNMKNNKKESQFTQRPLPSDEDVSRFEKNINKEIREVEISDNLEDIYKDKEGNLLDVSNDKFRKKKSWLVIIFKNIFIIGIILSALYLAYNYISNYYYASTGSPNLEIVVPERVVLGQEVTYIIKYSNPSMVALDNLSLELILPKAFVATDYSKNADSSNTWNLERLEPKENGEIIISGYFINMINFPNTASASLSYIPANFSSQFSKETSANTTVSELGFDIKLDYQNTNLLGQENEIKLIFDNIEDIYLDNFILKINKPDNFIFQDNESENIRQIEDGLWEITNINEDIIFKYVINEKKADHQGVSFSLEYQDLVFWEQNYLVEVLKSDLELILNINENRKQLAAGFNETLDYQLQLFNHGDVDILDLVLMVALEGEVLDLSSLKSDFKYQVMDNVIIFTKEEIEQLANFQGGASSTINFSLKTKNFNPQFIAQELKALNYAQYSLAGSSSQLEDNKSNEVEILINSDLSLSEELRYFDENNIPVGAGPLPPKVSEETNLRLYWTLTNNVHDLSDVLVLLDLPNFVEFADFSQATAGKLEYNADLHQVSWLIEDMPISIFRSDAYFNIKFTPSIDDLDRILVLSPGAQVLAYDKVSGGQISFKTSAKTTRLEDDEIALLNNNGRVIE